MNLREIRVEFGQFTRMWPSGFTSKDFAVVDELGNEVGVQGIG